MGEFQNPTLFMSEDLPSPLHELFAFFDHGTFHSLDYLISAIYIHPLMLSVL